MPDKLDAEEHGLILFDGICNFCNGWVNFLLKHDRAGYFRFAPLQSAAAQRVLQTHRLPQDQLASVILIEGGRCFVESDAVIRICRRLPGVWKLFAILRFIPRSWRDGAYRWVARHRYRLFGQRERCMIPTPEVRNRFLNED
ncbi:thiol-disulfide oxidoreductase DCC family protein [Brevibacillus fulvus]|uniref:DCC family thiol-disulfide oxidoreductase YuxK n=1 Tax=Brevibacillus fulvus TaxID=1125967 RepID=A0A938XUM6_9BACL|nr:thiol-disulfide oxidoreductase DCC family protein [Brevibacillus fulvus]MBM7590407.1 putative DCC family thiol-disulfide oxidoreductase YuxK [Brevibacillus fulvus]